MDVDDKSWKILSIIQREGRVSLKSLAETVGLSLPAASERLKRLEEAGVISGYGAKVVPEHVGYGITAIVGMTAVSSLKQQLIQHLSALPEVLECLHVTGQDSYLMRVVARDVRHLEAFICQISEYGDTRTSIIMSSPIEMRPVPQMA